MARVPGCGLRILTTQNANETHTFIMEALGTNHSKPCAAPCVLPRGCQSAANPSTTTQKRTASCLLDLPAAKRQSRGTQFRGKTQLHIAAASGSFHLCATILQDIAVDPTVTDSKGLTARDYAQRYGYDDIALLLDHAAQAREESQDLIKQPAAAKKEHSQIQLSAAVLPAMCISYLPTPAIVRQPQPTASEQPQATPSEQAPVRPTLTLESKGEQEGSVHDYGGSEYAETSDDTDSDDPVPPHSSHRSRRSRGPFHAQSPKGFVLALHDLFRNLFGQREGRRHKETFIRWVQQCKDTHPEFEMFKHRFCARGKAANAMQLETMLRVLDAVQPTTEQSWCITLRDALLRIRNDMKGDGHCDDAGDDTRDPDMYFQDQQNRTMVILRRFLEKAAGHEQRVTYIDRCVKLHLLRHRHLMINGSIQTIMQDTICYNCVEAKALGEIFDVLYSQHDHDISPTEMKAIRDLLSTILKAHS